MTWSILAAMLEQHRMFSVLPTLDLHRMSDAPMKNRVLLIGKNDNRDNITSAVNADAV
jgi:hypothetical protein